MPLLQFPAQAEQQQAHLVRLLVSLCLEAAHPVHTMTQLPHKLAAAAWYFDCTALHAAQEQATHSASSYHQLQFACQDEPMSAC
jgi:hypothetical protein